MPPKDRIERSSSSLTIRASLSLPTASPAWTTEKSSISLTTVTRSVCNDSKIRASCLGSHRRCSRDPDGHRGQQEWASRATDCPIIQHTILLLYLRSGHCRSKYRKHSGRHASPRNRDGHLREMG